MYDVNITIKGQTTFIHTYESGRTNEEVILLMHGYSGSALSFYKMLPFLVSRFHVFAIDFIGMGLSERNRFEFSGVETS